MLEPDRVRSVVDAYVDANRRNDKQACLDLFAPDAVWHDPVGEPPHVGHEGIGAFWDQARTLAESIVLEPKDVIVCANQAAMVFEIHATLPGGSTMVMDAVEMFVLDDDGAHLRAVGLLGHVARTHAR